MQNNALCTIALYNARQVSKNSLVLSDNCILKCLTRSPTNTLKLCEVYGVKISSDPDKVIILCVAVKNLAYCPLWLTDYKFIQRPEPHVLSRRKKEFT
jgi:hypothetical protein